MPAAEAEQLVRESEEPLGEIPTRYSNITTRTSRDELNRIENEDDEELDEDLENQYLE
ncbi:unnamed protein product, partial [Rotaria socialis]